MQAYGRLFAKVYNQQWRGFANHVSPLIFEYYESSTIGKRNKTLLDLCCGTGQLSTFFLEKGYRVVGLDLSEEMLKYARENALPYITAKQAEFVQGDAADFKLSGKFGLVVSTFDALNHLPDEDALQTCFRSTFDVLVDGGIFIFDLNTRKGLTNWNGVVVQPGEEIFYVNRSIYDDLTIRAWAKITGFVRNEAGLYERFDETVYNTVFELGGVQTMLARAGFKKVHFAGVEALGTPIENPDQEPRIFIIAEKM
jgi:SAM-dependent methyltransferase